MPGSLGSTKDAFSGESGDSSRAGVGIFFQQESDGRVYVKTIVSGGSAERDKTIRVGDVIIRVDDRDCTHEPLQVLRNMILGPQGTFVKLTFARVSSNGSIQPYDVRLMRGTAEYFSALDASYRRQGELDSLHTQLREALANGAQDHEELERVKKLLNLEREAAQRREADYQVVQREQTDEVMRLQDTLRKAEQGRREIELQLLPVAQREQDLTEDLNRQREKDMLRKEYIEELKKRHDDEKARLAALVAKEQRGAREDRIERMNVEAQVSKAQQDLQRLRETDKLRRERDDAFSARFDSERQRLAELLENQEMIRQQLREVDSRFALFHQELFGSSFLFEKRAAANNTNNVNASRSLQQPNMTDDNDNLFIT